MEMDQEDLAIFAAGEDVAFECLQVAPMGGDRCAILFLVSDEDFLTTISLVFVVESFKADSAREVLFSEDWLMSLSATPSGELIALEATVWAWRYDGESWTRDRISEIDLETIWAEDPAGPIAVGSQGQVLRRSAGGDWAAIDAPTPVQYTDVHGNASHGVFVCGELGTIHRIVDNQLEPIDIHRQDLLNGIDVDPDGRIRVAGDNGACLRIVNEEIVALDAEDMTYLAVRTFRGAAYWGGETGVFIEDGLRLAPVGQTLIASDLRADASFLYVAGAEAAWRFDGSSWRSLRLVYEDGFRLV